MKCLMFALMTNQSSNAKWSSQHDSNNDDGNSHRRKKTIVIVRQGVIAIVTVRNSNDCRHSSYY